MRVLVASDSYKGSLSSLKVGEAVSDGVRRVFPEATVRIIPIADGGEGTVQTLIYSGGGEYLYRMVTSPLGEKIEAFMGMLPDKTAVIEMAAASGLPLVPLAQRNPLLTTTKGTGELIKYALEEGAQRILIGIGGSATNDGGAGMAEALGVRFLDIEGQELPPGGASLINLHLIDTSGLDSRLNNVKIDVICDVDNPLCGERGASAVYGPQKGATNEMVSLLDEALSHYAKVIQEQLGTSILEIPGAGAAGGLGGGLLAFTKAELKSGTEAVLNTIRFDEILSEYDIVITGEGKIDAQSAYGKVPKGVGIRAQKEKKPVIAIVGSIGVGAELLYEHGITAIVPITDKPMNLDEAVQEAYSLVSNASERTFRLVRLGKNWNV